MCISSALFSHITNDVEYYLNTGSPSEANRFACEALRVSIVKKFEESTAAADEAAVKKFLEVNERMRTFIVETPDWDSQMRELLDSLQYDLWKVFAGQACVTPQEVHAGLKTGPGASVGVSGTSFIEKIATGSFSHTHSTLYQTYKAWTSAFDHLGAAEKQRTLEYGEAKLVTGSTLSCVPKNRDISRTICTEPLLNMMFQQGIGSAIQRRLKRTFGIELETQQHKNKRLARIGSIDGSFSTIDLSSASDSLSINMVSKFFPKELVDWLMWTRSSRTKLPSGNEVDLHMISSMGNAFTFPLQTFLFAAVVKVCYRHLGLPIVYPRGCTLGNFGVYGDDIIVTTLAAPLVIEVLARLGFVVNNEKTFLEGPFRESCGGDYYNGIDVRGVYARKLDTLQDIYSLINRLNRWSEDHQIAVPRTVQWLLTLIKRKVNYIPYDEQDTAGVKAPLSYASPRQAINKKTGSSSFLYEAYTPRTVKIEIPVLERYAPALCAQLLYGGMEHKRFNGEIEWDSVCVSVRPMGSRIKYGLTRRSTPRWEFSGMTTTDFCSRLPWKRNFTVINLG